MRFELPEDKKLTHEMVIPIRRGDMDAMGHVNNTVYFRYLEQARISWFESLGVDYGQGEGPILGNISCRFRIPIVYPAEVAISIRPANARNSSFVLYSEITDRSDGRLYATGEAVMVWIDLNDGKSRSLPDWLRALMQT